MSQRSPFNKRNSPVEEETKPTGMTKRSAARGKPARPAAQGVRVVSASGATKKASGGSVPLSKEERKAKRRAEREEEDQIASVANMVMRQDPEYVRNRRVWYVLLGGGFGVVIVSFFLSSQLSAQGNQNIYDLGTPLGVVSVVTLVLAYALIIGAIVWEFVKIRPIRNAATTKVRGMSQKKRQSVVAAEYEADERRRTEKAARKAAKK